MTEDAFLESAASDAEPPAGLSAELSALWLVRNDRWEESHNVAQDIDTSMGSWIHAHLHLIEGDIGNAGYWYRRAGKLASNIEQRQEEWRTIVAAVFEAPQE